MSLKVDWCSHKAAKFACEKWHYSESIPVPPLVKCGVWEKGKFKGVVIFSRGASSDLGTPYGLTQKEVCELSRVSLRNHEHPVSQIVTYAIKMMKRENDKMRLIVSFADPHQDHHGGIYQAMNWIYFGKTSPTKVYISPSGKELHSRQVSKKGYNKQFGVIRKTLKPSDCTVEKRPGKHRYLYPLDRAMRRKIAPLGKPYPDPV